MKAVLWLLEIVHTRVSLYCIVSNTQAVGRRVLIATRTWICLEDRSTVYDWRSFQPIYYYRLSFWHSLRWHYLKKYVAHTDRTELNPRLTRRYIRGKGYITCAKQYSSVRLLFHSRLDPLKLSRDPLQGVAGTPSSSNAALRPQRPYGLLGTGSPGRPPRLSHSFWAPKGVQGTPL